YRKYEIINFFFFSSRRRHTRSKRDWSSDVCSSDLDSAYLTAEVIEGDRIEVNRVKTKVIRGDHIILHEDVEVETVEYTKTLECRSEERRVGKECRYRRWRKR